MKTKTLFFISLVFNISIVAAYAVKYYHAHQPIPLTSTLNYTNNKYLQSIYSLLPIDSSDIVFVGNSLTERFHVSEWFPNAHAKNRGIGGNWTYQVINRLPPIVAAHPRKIFLEMGVNDLIAHASIDSILTNYRKAIAIVKCSPSTQVYIHSLTPTTYDYKYLNPAITQLNDSLLQYCEYYHVQYIDLYKDMVNGNELDTSLTTDGLHYNAKGYSIWEQKLKELVYQ